MFQVKLTAMESDFAAIETMPKIDLHRHISGAVRWSEAVRIAQKYGMSLRSRRDSPHLPMNSRFHATWHPLLPLFGNLDAVGDLLRSIAADATRDSVIYMELR